MLILFVFLLLLLLFFMLLSLLAPMMPGCISCTHCDPCKCSTAAVVFHLTSSSPKYRTFVSFCSVSELSWQFQPYCTLFSIDNQANTTNRRSRFVTIKKMNQGHFVCFMCSHFVFYTVNAVPTMYPTSVGNSTFSSRSRQWLLVMLTRVLLSFSHSLFPQIHKKIVFLGYTESRACV